MNVTVHDPIAKPEEVFREYGLKCDNKLKKQKYDAIVLTVSHSLYTSLDLKEYRNNNAVVYDVKSILGNFVNQSL